MYEYRVTDVAKVVDGDTFDVDVDLGFYAVLRIRVRLRGIDTWEIYGANAHELGVPARNAAGAWMIVRIGEETLGIRTFKLRPGTPVADGSFGRWEADIYDLDTGEQLADYLRVKGFEKQ